MGVTSDSLARCAIDAESSALPADVCPPILILAFNRPDTTAAVIDSLRAVRPAKVFFAVDGPRPQRQGEKERVLEVRGLVSRVDWPCEVKTLFRESNLGCKRAVSEAITWFFGGVEAGVILEDDCIAHPTFFPFAAELLRRFQDDERVMLVSGNNFQFGDRRTDRSYYYSRYNHIWGWASWRRAWKLYDHGMSMWPEARDGNWLEDVLGDRCAARYWSRIFEDTYSERNTSWAYRWTFACWMHGGLSALPNVNLVSNIGFGRGATHTTRAISPVACMEVEPCAFPIKHPDFMIRDAVADARTERLLFSGRKTLRGLTGAILQKVRSGLARPRRSFKGAA